MAMTREEFEKWWMSKTPTSSETVFGAIAWEAWQAAGVVEREACAKVCEDYEEHIETLRDGEYQAELAGRKPGPHAAPWLSVRGEASDGPNHSVYLELADSFSKRDDYWLQHQVLRRRLHRSCRRPRSGKTRTG